ncbi:MAG: cytochrome B6 [Planctomycetes bacterium RIFCSPHIGHO2_02_FULL_50_42]|nr:MAG: cytochrome B6 [Planctomycetes bacterium GWA2_50_13]OHB89910.1 MAG: cytochrome B6 [Planctomycetes bacterium RIFCSPHIGHO2_02_FULL_50_42]OHB91381.1 MAG: cytochrome B6 [Planctomycetes bacterium RIFCSPHIGHO2_12_FULL_51_37]OHB95495.1 MAG: cytochrome B6 [Planctomycetes bacterium RIFCSPLOWO2_02_FULL_50_16]OHC05144.1 MAG: cytochrome B6 [Planctomycetes bacterium RIFCSPLOWO2_12_FULL_50_35]HCN19256.1 cytochrome B6 [Planctomycetia bacterium]
MIPDLKKVIELITGNEIWKSVFRHSYEDTPRNRVLQIVGNVWMHIHPPTVRKESLNISYTFCLGGLTFFIFLFETLTGILLMFYYTPDVNRAYADMIDLSNNAAPFGRLLRNTHRWAGHAMVITVCFHMLRVFLTGAYKSPRQFNWVVGVVLLVLTLLLSFTGYLLPWDQLGYWAITVGTNMAGATPFAGYQGPFADLFGFTIDNDIRFALLGGTSIQAPALLRAYVWHCIALPSLAGGLIMLHFWRVRKDGFSGQL